jgi:hypothetical protein
MTTPLPLMPFSASISHAIFSEHFRRHCAELADTPSFRPLASCMPAILFQAFAAIATAIAIFSDIFII